MANQKHYSNAPTSAAFKGSAHPGTGQEWTDRARAAEAAVEQLTAQISTLQDSLDLAAKVEATRSEAAQHDRQRLEDQISILQRSMLVSPAFAVGTPESALTLIINQLAAVAFGGPAIDLRQAVHAAAAGLDVAGKHQLHEFAVRLRAASEAVAQESTTLLL